MLNGVSYESNSFFQIKVIHRIVIIAEEKMQIIDGMKDSSSDNESLKGKV